MIELEKIGKTYAKNGQRVCALGAIDLVVRKGEFLAIAGPSGSGKTTLLNLVGCLDRPSSGEIRIDGEAVSAKSKNELAALRRAKIGFVFQTFNLIPVLSALENVAFSISLLGESEARALELGRAALAEVGLAGLEDRRPGELSGGQQQRVAVARALVKRPALVLADEPTANLDSKTGEAIMDLMAELNARHGATFVFSTHDPMVMARARRLVKLHDGAVASDEERGSTS